MPARECFAQAFVITGKPTEAAQPAERSLDHPSARQQHESFLGFAVFDNLQLDAVIVCLLRCVVARVLLVHKRDLNMVPRDFLHLSGQLGHLGALLLVGSRDFQSQQIAQRINGPMHFGAVFFLPPS